MTRRALGAAWITLAVVFVVLLGWELLQWRAFAGDNLRVGGERRRLTDEIALRDAQIAAELRGQAPVLRDLRWMAGADPGSFLTRLADLARDQGVRVTAVGPLERQVTPQWTRTWHTVQVVAPYREVRELASRIESARGVLDDVRLEIAPAAAPVPARPGAPAPADLVQARFRLTTIELTPPARRIVERALAAAPAPAPDGTAAVAAARDPFAFALPKPPAPPPPAAPRVEPPPVPLDLTAIVGFPGSYLAIVNNQVVKVGDVVSGHQVLSITENAVSLRESGAPPRTLQLPELGTAPPPPGLPAPPTRR